MLNSCNLINAHGGRLPKNPATAPAPRRYALLTFFEEAGLQIMTNEMAWLAIIVLGPTATYFVPLWIAPLLSALR
ncbi:hypothetical protein EN933_04805 [Mesorhizobium sp. M7A.F.Ca.US.001.01.1.1]|nr:hypothetical protein EN933_04805 [Mesorhizobium sp. M7A.F.Ca.US.001.01.1.1]